MPDNVSANDKTQRAKAAEDCRTIAEKASRETNPSRLIELVEDLCHKIEERGGLHDSKKPPKS